MATEELNEIDRLQGSLTSTELLGVEIPKVTLPVAPGRELAILVETAARQHIQRLRGYHANQEFIDRQQATIDEKR
jgi:HPr kinase/phosphorylase